MAPFYEDQNFHAGNSGLKPPGEDDIAPPGEENDDNKEKKSNSSGTGGEEIPLPPEQGSSGWTPAAQPPSLMSVNTPGMPGTTVNGVRFSLTGQRISGFNPYPSPLQMPGSSGKNKKKKKKKGQNAGNNPSQTMNFVQGQGLGQVTNQGSATSSGVSETKPSNPTPSTSGGAGLNASDWPPALRYELKNS